jgi:hypothetical protein
MALKPARRRVDEEGKAAVEPGEIQGPLGGALGGSSVAEHVAGDRLQTMHAVAAYGTSSPP